MSELTLSAADIAAAISKGLDGYTPSVEARTVGRVAEIGDGIRASAVCPTVRSTSCLSLKTAPWV